ncbi:GntR family transcriptional regulator [Sporolactobacillus shoreae]|uniref:GntR family transcriptional regulator n=1 Tax=Sporolactobacillus shoreae TaxID=1465501 RepID=A0A4Z0GR64_9BACL|nr:winged helix-turn-helix domain-containing protein [Sporolactobacillus shoreae]TGA98936.1 GntR family transcriptional regulator [Sporolactobacillus shoreae]
MEIVPELDNRLKDPLYSQLYQYFKAEIEKSALQRNTHLPSIRYLADTLNVSHTTVQMAYQQLLADGYIKSKERSGYYVAELDSDFINSADIRSPNTSSAGSAGENTGGVLYDFFITGCQQRKLVILMTR